MSPSSIERFPYPVDRLDQLDPFTQAALSEHLELGEVVKRIIVAPPKEMVGIPREWRQRLDVQPALSRITSWALVLTEQRLLVATISRSDMKPPVVSIPIAKLLWVEVGTILLFSWFECAWVSQDRVQRIRVFFNTVGEEYFQQLRILLCRTAIEQDGLAAMPGDRNLVELDSLSYKFVNMISIRMLLPDEHIERLVSHPTIWQKHLMVFKRRRAPSTVVILTNYHLLVGNEDPSQHDATYGWITRYCPRQRVRKVSLQTVTSEITLYVTVGLDNVEETFSILFPAEMAPSLAGWASE